MNHRNVQGIGAVLLMILAGLLLMLPVVQLMSKPEPVKISSGPTIPPGPWDDPDCDSHGCTDTW